MALSSRIWRFLALISEISSGSLCNSSYLYLLPSNHRVPALTLALNPLYFAKVARALKSLCWFACCSVKSSFRYTLLHSSLPCKFFRFLQNFRFFVGSWEDDYYWPWSGPYSVCSWSLWSCSPILSIIAHLPSPEDRYA